MSAPLLEVLEPGEPERAVAEACSILAGIGVRVDLPEARRLLEGAGATRVGERYLLPEALVRGAAGEVPGRIVLFDREGQPAADLGGRRVHFNPGSSAVHVLDGDAGRRRPATSADVIEMVALVDSLPHFAAQSTALTPCDVPEDIADRYRLYLALRHGRKPVVTGTFRADAFASMHAMLAAVRGGAHALADRPLALFDCCPVPPLRWGEVACQALIDCARAGVPANVISVPLAGATAPVTLRDAVVQHCAENLSGLVIHQLAARGAPVLWGTAAAAFDMRRGTAPLAAPESMLMAVAAAQVGRHLGLPTHAYLALSDAKRPDYQAGLESGTGALVAALAGINLVSGPGLLDYLLTHSPEKLLLDHEACGLALRIARGIGPGAGEAPELWRELARTGQLLAHPHTRAHWREELSVPSPLIDRETYGDWDAAGAADAAQRAHDLRTRRPPDARPLDAGRASALDEVMRAEARRSGVLSLPA